MSEYIFDTHKADRELHRLKLIEAAFDSDSISFLNKTPLKKDWHCLEIGPGAGSIFAWMGKKVGAGGRVVGVDKNTKYLAHFEEAPFEVIQGNFAEMSFEGPFDLLHCRYVLIHNPEEKQLIPKIKKVLKPGATLVLEEPDFTCAMVLNNSDDLPQQRVNRAICRMFVDVGLNPAYGLSLPLKLEQNGFEIVEVKSNMHLCPGGSPVAQVMGESAKALREKYVATGETNDADIQQYITHAENAQYWSVFYSTISVIAKRSFLL